MDLESRSGGGQEAWARSSLEQELSNHSQTDFTGDLPDKYDF